MNYQSESPFVNIEVDNGSRIVIDQKAWSGEIHDYLKTDNGEREVDVSENASRLLREYIGDRKTGLLFRTKHGRQLMQSNILRRHLHPALERAGFERAGGHAFRRFRNTYLRNQTNCAESVRNFWLGWEEGGMSEHYDKIRNDVAFRQDVANRCGVGFDVPETLTAFEPVEPKPECEVVAVTA